jgi:putative oxidoreductase
MLGAIQKKIFVWHTGFWGEKTYGWHYDLMLVMMNLVILFTNGGRLGLMKEVEYICLTPSYLP